MSDEKEAKFSLTLMKNEDKTKVLFAVVDISFADVLLSFMTLPLGQILLLLRNHYGDKAPRIGSLNTLYNGLQNLDDVYFGKKACKLMLLNPISSLEYEECIKLKLNICRPQPTQYYRCGCPPRWVSLYHEGALCFLCRKLMNRAIEVKSQSAAKGDSEVFTKNTASFVISDDLQMLPNVTIGSLIQNLKSLGVAEIHGAQKITMEVGFNEIMDLLKGLLFSKTPLTDLFVHNGQIAHHQPSTIVSEQFSIGEPELKKARNCSSKKIKINVIVRKSNNKFLFAQVENDFVDFLFCLLTIPLGQVKKLLNVNSGLGSIDNLYKSVADLNDEKCLVSQDKKDILLNPKLSYQYYCNNHMFPLEEQSKHKLYYTVPYDGTPEWSHSKRNGKNYDIYFDNPKHMGSYVQRKGLFKVTDDLTVTPLLMHQNHSTVLDLEFPLTYIEELEVTIGLEEALSILKASLTTSCAMTAGLKLNTVSRKQPKQEH